MIDTVQAIDDATDRAGREVSAQLTKIIQDSFGPDATYNNLEPDQRSLVGRIAAGMVYDLTMKNLNGRQT